jgi:hypothetical protein
MAVALLALFISLGGSSYAAFSVTGKNVKNSSLTGTDVKNSSLTSADIRDRSLLARDFKSGQLPAGPAGVAGAKGDAGPQGPAGIATAYALVAANGTVDPNHSKGITQDMVSPQTGGQGGGICFSHLPFEPKSIQVTPQTPTGFTADSTTVVAGEAQAGIAGCPAGTVDELKHAAWATERQVATVLGAAENIAGTTELYVWFEA